MLKRKTTKATQAWQNLHMDIINGHWIEGEKLPMQLLKERYNVGYSPLREALSRLVTYGLVEVEEQCGFKVRGVSLKDFYDLYMLRKNIDGLAFELAIENGNDQWEAEMVANFHQFAKYNNTTPNNKIDVMKWTILQKDFLISLIKGCASPWLIKISVMLYDQATRYRILCLRNNFNKKDWRCAYLNEKEKLMRALLSRDKQKALKIAEKGWDQAIKGISEILKAKYESKKE